MQTTQQMHTIEIARRLGALGQKEDACKAYTLALQQAEDGELPELELEAALYLFQNGGDYKVAYTTFYQLYNRGYCQEELLSLITGAFYEPNAKQMKTRYEKNCKLLQKYPYLFRKDFLPFEELPIKFFPFDDKGYLPFDTRTARFGEYVNFSFPRVTRNFFKDLEKPILADDVFSSYELHYLNDNVRKSEYVARENHIYLHYTDWGTFCAHLQVWNLRTLLTDKKIVFLIGDEISQYPIDFKTRFGIDYSQYPVEPLHIREINRLIWHTQLSSHNGGDFFNEIFDSHPNLIAMSSIMFDKLKESMDSIRLALRDNLSFDIPIPADGDINKCPRLFSELAGLKNLADKDVLVFFFLCASDLRNLDPASRIAPALFLQPHFHNIIYEADADPHGITVLDSEEYREIQRSSIFNSFPYIKTFTPMRRMTTSYGATVRFMNAQTENVVEDENGQKKFKVVTDVLLQRMLNRSFMIDPQDRLFQDSVLVRFEDGKLNPKATFTALCAFLDLPYTESMTYCSWAGEKNPHADVEGWYAGFDLTGVYKTYDEYAGEPERILLEYFMRDAYEYYGYDFRYYDGSPMDMERVRELVDHITVQDRHMRDTWINVCAEAINSINFEEQGVDRPEEEKISEISQELLERKMKEYHDNRIHVSEILLRNLRFVNKNGQPLKMMPLLQLDPNLLEQPLYR